MAQRWPAIRFADTKRRGHPHLSGGGALYFRDPSIVRSSIPVLRKSVGTCRREYKEKRPSSVFTVETGWAAMPLMKERIVSSLRDVCRNVNFLFELRITEYK